MGRPRKIKIEATHEPLQAEIHENGASPPPVVAPAPNGGVVAPVPWPVTYASPLGQVVHSIGNQGAPKLTPTVTEQLGRAIPMPMETVYLPQLPKAPMTGVKPLKVALIGTAPSSRMLAPFGDESWEIWVCSPGNVNQVPRVSLWFEIHANIMWPENQHYGAPYVEWLNKQTFPIYMQNNLLVPKALTFPRAEMVKQFGGDFFTSSFAWMMAFAMTKGAVEIALYGIDMASRDEYILQRPGFYFFKYIAEQRGIKVSAPNESDIMQSPPQYGYWEATPYGRKLMAREKELRERLAQMRPQRDGLIQQITYLEGALEDMDYFKSIWGGAQGEALLP